MYSLVPTINGGTPIELTNCEGYFTILNELKLKLKPNLIVVYVVCCIAIVKYIGFVVKLALFTQTHWLHETRASLVFIFFNQCVMTFTIPPTHRSPFIEHGSFFIHDLNRFGTWLKGFIFYNSRVLILSFESEKNTFS